MVEAPLTCDVLIVGGGPAGLSVASRLPDDVKYTLHVASVVGRQFTVTVLEQVVNDGQGRTSLISHLSQLESAGLVRLTHVSPELNYRFRNVLVQDAAYASLLASDRQRLHLAVGEALEWSYPERLVSRELAVIPSPPA